jgi:hypothetical protein
VRGIALGLLLSALATSAAWAQSPSERSAARELGNQGLEDYQRGDFEAALDKLRRAHEIVRLPTTGVWLARTLEQLGRLVEASERYLEVTRMTLANDALPQHVQAKDEAVREREALMPRIPRLTIVFRGSGEVRLDGNLVATALVGVPQPVDPGTHRVEAIAGSAHDVEEVTLAERESREVVLELPAAGAPAAPAPIVAAPAPSPAPVSEGSSSHPVLVLGGIGLALGGAGLVAGAVTGGLAIGKKSTLDEGCDAEGRCGPELHDDVDAYGTLRVVSAVGLYVGAALAVGGLVLVLTAPDSEEQTGLVLGPAGLGVEGRF